MRRSKFWMFLLLVLGSVACSVLSYAPNPRPTATLNNIPPSVPEALPIAPTLATGIPAATPKPLPTTTPDKIATGVAEARAIAATLTAEAPTETPKPLPTVTPDNIATGVAEARAVAATLTAKAPTMTPISTITAARAHTTATVDYSTFLGGNGNTVIYGVAVCSDGSVIAAGGTNASNLPVTPGAFDTTYNYTVPSDDNSEKDGFVAKFDAAGALKFLTYLGGSSSDHIYAVAVDEQCSIYLTGSTQSADFPTTKNAYDRTFNGDGRDTFVTKLSSDGSTLLYSTYLGGTNWDYGFTIAVDTAHNAYVGGFTHGGYPVTAGAADVTFGSPGDGFVAKLNADGSQLVYATYLGRDGEWDAVSSIAVDNLGAVYVPITAQGDKGGVTKISPDGRRFEYSTPLPGSSNNLAVDSQRNVYVVGYVSAATGTYFPVTADAFQSTYGGGERDLTIAKLDQNGVLIYGSYFGGNGLDAAGGHGRLAIDAAGNIYFTGSTNSTNFPLAQPFQSALGGNYDAFVVKFNVATGPVLSSYLGGSAGENSYGDGANFYETAVAVDNSGHIYMAGRTDSADFPTTPHAFDTTFNGPAYDGFLTKISSR
jgi:hypothetical protein